MPNGLLIRKDVMIELEEIYNSVGNNDNMSDKMQISIFMEIADKLLTLYSYEKGGINAKI